ncbi:MAG: CHRD domain-containing protein [Balneolaceae bacterium]|nr:CHRD domain-containing protein [Balneolaceae bacterium]
MRTGKIIISAITFLLISTSLFAQTKKTVIMTGLEMVPDIHTPATGGGEVWVESDTLYVRLEFENLKAPYYSANIHFGEEGENGNPIYKLNPVLSENHRSGAFDPETNKFALSDAMKEAYENGNLYVNIASDRHKRGEIRGQIDKY